MVSSSPASLHGKWKCREYKAEPSACRKWRSDGYPHRVLLGNKRDGPTLLPPVEEIKSLLCLINKVSVVGIVGNKETPFDCSTRMKWRKSLSNFGFKGKQPTGWIRSCSELHLFPACRDQSRGLGIAHNMGGNKPHEAL